mmetsp:Transcript_19345/g.19467  ORF Transcript_19345/g.19467 Transcript_19345/m.19467 type:complete len:80 (-) Transcript_19345:256-495(-)
MSEQHDEVAVTETCLVTASRHHDTPRLKLSEPVLDSSLITGEQPCCDTDVGLKVSPVHSVAREVYAVCTSDSHTLNSPS